MNPWRWVDPRVDQVRLAQAHGYLLHRGWVLKASPNPTLLRFEEPPGRSDPPLFQMVPSSEQRQDFRQRMVELITTLSEIEDRHPVEILDEMLRPKEENGREQRA
jgi:hypothetical protein